MILILMIVSIVVILIIALMIIITESAYNSYMKRIFESELDERRRKENQKWKDLKSN